MRTPEEHWAALRSASEALFDAAKQGEGVGLDNHETAALAGALIHFTFVATSAYEPSTN
jgi:hypothetical protein